MADLKISQLTSATLPLAGTEVLPIVQSSTTKKVATDDLTVKNIRSNATTGILQIAGPAAAATRTMTVPDANFTAARTDAANSFTADQTFATGNLIQGTAAKGVNFTANTPAAGMNSQLLAWYEEGNWTPTVQGSGTAGTYEINTGITKCTYTRIGRLVHVSAYIVLAGSITGGGTGDLTVTGLPFPKGNNIAAWGSVAFNNVNYNANANLACYFGGTGSSSTIYFWETNDNAGVTLTPISGVSAGCVVAFSISYEA